MKKTLYILIIGMCFGYNILPCSIRLICRMRIVEVKTTAYCWCKICCGSFSDGVTSIGRNAKTTVGIAIDPNVFDYGDKFFVSGNGKFWKIRIADDTGGAMRQSTKKGVKHIDIRMASHQKAREYGVKNKYVLVLKKG